MAATAGNLSASFTRPQCRFLNLEKKFRAFVGGYGSGKTWVGCGSLINHMIEHPRVPLGYFAPTYPQIRDIFYPTIDEVAYGYDMRTTSRTADKEVDLFRGRKYYGTIIARSMERPETIVGFKIGRGLADEIDTMKKEKARAAWRKTLARLRWVEDQDEELERWNAELGIQEIENGMDVATTPEGFNFVHSEFVELVREDEARRAFYGLVHASTYENERHLPKDYIASLLATYPANLIEAYLEGKFVNLKTGTVYHAYNRNLNGSDRRIKYHENGGAAEPLYIGMDFNVGKMAAIVCVRDALDNFHVVDEIHGALDTPDMCRMIKERYWRYDGDKYQKTCEIRIYPDSSGKNRTTKGASVTDISQLQDPKVGGFSVHAPSQNPPVKDRINSVNALLCNALGVRSFFVNDKMAPTLAKCLEQQAWTDKGEPDKDNDLDHPVDAVGYLIHFEKPLIKPAVNVNIRMGR